MLILYPTTPILFILFFITSMAKAVYSQILYNTTDLARFGFKRPTKNTNMSEYVSKILTNKNIIDVTKTKWENYNKWKTLFNLIGWLALIDFLSFLISLFL